MAIKRILRGFLALAAFAGIWLAPVDHRAISRVGAQNPPPEIYLPIVQRGGGQAVNLEILPNSSTYFDGYFRRHVVGEIKNNGNKPATSVVIQVDYYDDTGQLADSNRASLYLNSLAPDDATCYDVYVGEIAGFSRYQVSIADGIPTDQYPPHLAASVANAGFDEMTGGFKISGSVKNETAKPLQDVMLVSTLYDSNQKVIDCDYDYAAQSTLGTGSSSNYSVYFLKRSAADYMDLPRFLRIQPTGVQ